MTWVTALGVSGEYLCIRIAKRGGSLRDPWQLDERGQQWVCALNEDTRVPPTGGQEPGCPLA